MTVGETIITEPVPPRQDSYIHYAFNELNNPEFVDLALKVHAEGYTTMGYVSSDAVGADGALLEAIDHARGVNTDYFLAVNPNEPSDMATMRKINIPAGGSIEELPAYQLSKVGLSVEGLSFLKALGENGLMVKEIAGLARTKDASPACVYELLRDVLQSALGENEVWFFSIVSTTFDSLTRHFGKTAFTVIGDDVKINDSRVSESIQLRPTLLHPDRLFESMITDIETALSKRDQLRILKMFLYFTDGLQDDELDLSVSNYRRNLLELLKGAQTN